MITDYDDGYHDRQRDETREWHEANGRMELSRPWVHTPCKCGFCETDSDHFNHGLKPSVAQMRYLRSVCPADIDFDTWATEYKLHRYNLVTAEIALTGKPYAHGL